MSPCPCKNTVQSVITAFYVVKVVKMGFVGDRKIGRLRGKGQVAARPCRIGRLLPKQEGEGWLLAAATDNDRNA